MAGDVVVESAERVVVDVVSWPGIWVCRLAPGA